jgi:hypothetical protein
VAANPLDEAGRILQLPRVTGVDNVDRDARPPEARAHSRGQQGHDPSGVPGRDQRVTPPEDDATRNLERKGIHGLGEKLADQSVTVIQQSQDLSDVVDVLPEPSDLRRRHLGVRQAADPHGHPVHAIVADC